MTSCMSSKRSNQLSYASATVSSIAYRTGFVNHQNKKSAIFYCLRQSGECAILFTELFHVIQIQVIRIRR